MAKKQKDTPKKKATAKTGRQLSKQIKKKQKKPKIIKYNPKDPNVLVLD